MKRVVLVFVVLFLLCCCCSPVVQQGCYQFVELWVISFLELGCMFPLIVVDINELLYLPVKGQTIVLVTANVDGESQSSKEVSNYIL